MLMYGSVESLQGTSETNIMLLIIVELINFKRLFLFNCLHIYVCLNMLFGF